MPETLPSTPQGSRIGVIPERVRLVRWLIMAAIAVGPYFVVTNAVSDTPDKDDIVLLQPKGGAGMPKTGKTESKEDHATAAGDKSEKKAIKTPLNIREKYKPENVCYIGDSYMAGITNEGEIRSNIFAKNGRPFVSEGGKWDGDDIETAALEALESADCRLVVINGGLNDFHSNHRRLGIVITRLKKAYSRIFEMAKEKGAEVIIFDVPKIPKFPMDMEGDMEKRAQRKKEIDDATEIFNRFLSSLEGAHVLDTMAILQSSCEKPDKCRIWRKDNIHPGPKGYKALFESL